MSDVHDADERAEGAATSMVDGETQDGFRVSRRAALVGGALGVAAVLGVGDLETGTALAATTAAAATTFVPVPSGVTAPEQLRLAWGADPTTQVTVSWSAPGTTAMPAPRLTYSREPLSAHNVGTVVVLPTTPSPLNLQAGARRSATLTSFTDGLTGETTYHYHVPLSGLEPGTQYFYEVSDGASPIPSTAGGSFFTAPAGRAAYRFTAFGDIGTPYTNNPSGYNWTESSDVSVYTVDGVVNPGDGQGAGLFHLMLGDLSYANVDPGSQPAVWRDYQANVSPASANQPWMPIMGNHEVELGTCNLEGTPSTTPYASPYNGPYYNGPYGAGNYLARHLLPDNGLTNSDGNSLQGSFYSFQVGTVLFICLNTNDVVFQNPQTQSTGSSGKTPFSPATPYNSGVVYTGTNPSVTQYLATGNLAPVAATTQLVPDTSSGKPHLQTQWLQQQLQAARAPGSSVDMVVVCEHHCALSTGPSNGCDMGIRAAWVPLYDQYEVDLVIGGHDHDYEASYPVRGYDTNLPGTATAAFTDPWGDTYAVGAPVNTRRPTVVQTAPTTLPNGKSAWNTGAGTVYLQLGGAGAAAGKTPSSVGGVRQAMVWAKDTGVSGTQCATEPATWSRVYDSSSNYGYAVFDVDPGDGPGQTTLTYQWFSVPMPTLTGDQEPGVTTAVEYGSGPALPIAPYEEFVFMRSMSGQVAISGASGGTVKVGTALSATTSGWPSGVSYAYQWLRNGNAISGATATTYTTAAADDGQQLSVQVTGTAQSFPATAVSSAGVTVTDGSLALATPTISGTPAIGQMLTANANVSISGAVYAYQWLRDGGAIYGANGVSYTPQGADGGQQISVRVTVSAPSYAATSGTSAAVSIPAAGAAPLIGVPTISGTGEVGQLLTATPAAGSGTVFYQWLRDGNPIEGATRPTYRLVARDGEHDVQVRVASDTSTQYAVSLAMRVANAAFRTAEPKIHGTAIVGQTLTAEVKVWSPEPKLSYQWLLDGNPIEGATHQRLKVTEACAGKRIRVRVTGTHPGYNAKTVVSAVAAVHTTAQKARKPKISGKALVGQTLHAHVGEWLPGTEFTYRWYADGREVPGATGHAFRLEPQLRGRRIGLIVTARLAGQEDVSVRSAQTRVVRRPWTWL